MKQKIRNFLDLDSILVRKEQINKIKTQTKGEKRKSKILDKTKNIILENSKKKLIKIL